MKIIKKSLAILLVIIMTAMLLPLPGMAAGAEYEVGDASALNTRLEALQSGDLLKLTGDISYSNNYATQFDGKTVIIDLNGHNLSIGSITVGSGGNLSVINTATTTEAKKMTVRGLTANNGGVIGTANGGVLNMDGTLYGGNVTASGTGSSVTVNDVASNSYAVSVVNGGSAVVNGNIIVNTSYSGVYGISAEGDGCVATVNGNITVNGKLGNGVYIKNVSAGTGVTVNGSISVIGSDAYGVSLQNNSNATVTVTGDILATSHGISISSGSTGSGNTVVVNGNVTAQANSGMGARIMYSAGDSITVHGNVIVTGEVNQSSNRAYGVAAFATCTNSTITVDGSISITGNDAYGATSEGADNEVNVGQNITSTLYGVNVLDTDAVVFVGGNVTAAGTGVTANNGGKATITGDVTTNITGSGNYNCVSAGSASIVEVMGNVSLNGSASVTCINATGVSTINVTGSVTATSSADSATGVYADGSKVTVGDITATGANYSTTGVSVSTDGAKVTAGVVSASGGTSNYGIKASGITETTVKGIAAGTYITMYSPNATRNIGGGTLNNGYFEYLNGSTLVKVKAWTMTVDHNTGGVAGIGGTAVTTGTYEASRALSLEADDNVAGYNFGSWTSSAGGSFSNLSSKTPSFTMPAADVIVTANFHVAVPHGVITTGITGGTVSAVPSSAEAGETVTLTVAPNSDQLFVAGSLKYYDGTYHTLTVTSSTATFVMPDGEVTVSAMFEAITVPDITTTTLPGGMETVSYNQTLTYESNAPVDWSVTVGDLPTGLTLSATGVISGTPTAAGTFGFTVQALNGGGSRTQAFTVVILSSGPEITPAALADATEDAPYSVTLDATGISGIAWTVTPGSLPVGLSLNAVTGEISGTPSVEISSQTSYTFTIKAENLYGSDTITLTLVMQPAPEYTFTIQSDANGSITAGTTGTYEQGAQFTISAAPATDDYVFDSWQTTVAGSIWNENNSPTTFFMPGKDVTVTAIFKPVYDVNIAPMTDGSVTTSLDKVEAGDTVTVMINPEPGKQLKFGSLKYYDGTDHYLTVSDGFASFTMPSHAVTISAEFEEKSAIEVGSAYDLYDVLDNLSSTDIVKIKLTSGFTYSSPIYISGTTVIFDLNGYTLLVDTVDSGEKALSVTNSGSVDLTGTGALNVRSDYMGVYAENGGSATVTNTAGVGASAHGVYASGGTVIVKGNASSNGDNSFAVFVTSNGTVTVDGKVTAEGDGSRGLCVAYSNATVTGDIAVSGDNSYGLYVEQDGSATVNGNISATGESAVAVCAFNTDAVEILGSIIAEGADAVGVYADYSIVTVEKAIIAPFPIILYDGSEISLNIGDGVYAGNEYFVYATDSADACVLVRGWELTFEAGTGGSILTDSDGFYEAGRVISVSAEASAGYNFSSWTATPSGSFDNAAGTSTSFTMPAAATTVKARFAIPAPSGGGGGGGGTSEPTSNTSTSGNTTTTTTSVTATTNASSTATASISQAQLEDAAKDALKEAALLGTEAEVEIAVSTNSSATGLALTIPQSALDTISDSGVGILTISSPAVTVRFDERALTAISDSDSGSITISVVTADAASLSDDYLQLVGDRPVYELSVSSGGEVISSFDGGTATVSIKYTPRPTENTSKIVIYYISDGGRLTIVPHCSYDPTTGMVTFKTTHFSTYAIGYNDISFTDVSGWYLDDVYYLATRDIMKGPGGGLFNPDGSMTRAELAQLLYRLSGAPSIVSVSSPFSDVSTTDWFFNAVQWAYDTGIITGFDGKFDPNAPVSRQDIAIMLVRYVENGVNRTLPLTDSALEFNDRAEISQYALSAVTTMQSAGIISGYSDGSFKPHCNVTRAEAAKIIATLMQAL